MQMDAGLDTGDVLYHKETEILPSDTTAVLHDRLARIGSQCIVDVLQKICFFGSSSSIRYRIIYASKIDKNESKLTGINLPLKLIDKLEDYRHFQGRGSMMESKESKC